MHQDAYVGISLEYIFLHTFTKQAIKKCDVQNSNKLL